MALFHAATITPTKEELITRWAPKQPWGPPADAALTFVGAYRFDDPDGAVGMETFLVGTGGGFLHVPLTYRDAPRPGGDDGLITTMEHSALGTRWVYDGLSDPTYLTMLAAVTMSGQGEALGMVVRDGRWFVAPTRVRITGGGWGLERVPVDGFERAGDDGADAIFRNDRFELVLHRRPVPGPRPPIALLGSWDTQPEPLVLAELRSYAGHA